LDTLTRKPFVKVTQNLMFPTLELALIGPNSKVPCEELQFLVIRVLGLSVA